MNEINDKKEINFSINVIKCLAIFSVIIIHCGIFSLGRKGTVIEGLARFAVPFFFLISGYYSYYKLNNKSMMKYKERIIRLTKLLIISSILFIIFNFFIFQKLDINNVNLLKQAFNIIIFDNYFYGGHLWFIGALIYCYIFYYLLGKFKIDFKNIYIYIPILLIICLLLSEFAKNIGISIPNYYYRNFLFMGLPFFSIGHFIHHYQENFLEDISNKPLILTVLGACFLIMIEVLHVGMVSIYVGTTILSISIFLWCVKNPNKLKKFRISGFIGGRLYTSMYILHFLILLYFQVNSISLGYFAPIAIFIITAVISYIIYLIKLIFKNLNKKYSVF